MTAPSALLPLRFVLQVRRFVPGAVDRHGNAVETFGPSVAWPVYGVAPGANEEFSRTNRDRGRNRDLSQVIWTVYAPAGPLVPGERDRVLIDGVEYQVDGRPRDWTWGPWQHPTAGAVVELIRSEG